eukprot:746239-Hanusia_phi.AAC.17
MITGMNMFDSGAINGTGDGHPGAMRRLAAPRPARRGRGAGRPGGQDGSLRPVPTVGWDGRAAFAELGLNIAVSSSLFSESVLSLLRPFNGSSHHDCRAAELPAPRISMIMKYHIIKRGAADDNGVSPEAAREVTGWQWPGPLSLAVPGMPPGDSPKPVTARRVRL